MTNEETLIHALARAGRNPRCDAWDWFAKSERLSEDWQDVTCSDCLIIGATPNEDRNEEITEARRTRLLAALSETRAVWQQAAREADTWQGILDRALRLAERIEAELNSLSVSLPDERSEVRGQDTPVTPAAFLADLSRFATRQRAVGTAVSAGEEDWGTAMIHRLLPSGRESEILPLAYKPMPY